MDNTPFTFLYHDGEKDIHGDPLTLHRALVRATAGQLEELLKQARSDDPATAVLAAEKVIDCTRVAFDLIPYDRLTGRGVMDRDALAILKRFRDADSSLKKKRE